jgi:hypothetical protein
MIAEKEKLNVRILKNRVEILIISFAVAISITLLLGYLAWNQFISTQEQFFASMTIPIIVAMVGFLIYLSTTKNSKSSTKK